MSKKLLITGGVLRPNGFELGDGRFYGCAKLLRLNVVGGVFEELIAINTGNENFPDEYPNLEFTCGCVDGKGIWIPTDTEVRYYSYPELNLQKSYSHPCFHNIHSVAVRKNKLYITSTGLDMLVVLNKYNGKIIEQINTEGKDVWHRFDPNVDYRKLHSTRPHDCHPNFVFWIEGEIWVTRCTQEDAVNLPNCNKCIDISLDKNISVHDGIEIGQQIAFTTVDGCIVLCDKAQLKVVETIELSKFHGFGGVRGWCRGLYYDNDTRTLYIGFSRLRKTRSKGKLSWIRNAVSGSARGYRQASILAVDLDHRRIVQDYPVPEGMIDAIYSIIPEPV